MLRAPADLSILNLRDVCCHLWLFFASANLWAIASTELDTRNSGAQAARCWSRRGKKKKDKARSTPLDNNRNTQVYMRNYYP